MTQANHLILVTLLGVELLSSIGVPLEVSKKT